MSVTFDHSLVGTEMPNPPLSNKPPNYRRIMVKKMVNQIKAAQDFYVELDDNDKITSRCQAFIDALKLLKNWSTVGAERTKTFHEGQTWYEVTGRINYNRLQKMRTVIWAEGSDGEKTYYNFSKLTREQIPQVFEIFSGRSALDENYQGLETMAASGRDVRKVGVSFFASSDRKFRKVAEEPVGDDLDVLVYRKHIGGFFAFVSLIPVNLERFGIYTEINKKNYKDNCFVQACIESKVLDSTEIDSLRSFIRTRDIPRGKIRQIAEYIKCNFKIKYIDDKKLDDSRHYGAYDMDTTKGANKKDYGRTIKMILFKEHYMLDDPVMITPFYIEHYDDIQKKFPDMPKEEQMLLANISGRKSRTKNGYSLTEILVAMFKFKRFRPIFKQESDIIATREYDEDTLQDYVDLDYNEELCCKLVEDDKKPKEYSYIIYADFESDITTNPHRAYLCCCVWRDKEGRGKKIAFRGYHCASQFLEWVPDNALIYFHNLKYDASFFINVSKNTYNVNMIEHSGKVMMLKFRQMKGESKQFTIKDSYSIISAPLKAFGSMFNLEVHKEVCPYNVYTQDNLKKKFIPLDECLADIAEEDRETFTNNCIEHNFLHQPNNTVDIVSYAEFYCIMDCKVLMLGMEKFDDDLSEIFKTNNKTWDGVKSYLSISAIGYEFTIKYGCLEGVYALAGKPQDFISRCVSGGRTMCANNEKQLIEARIQDFDAVSLYPSAMSIMPGIPLGKPKIITDLSRDNIMKYDDFYVEININRIQAKGVKEYRFSLVFQNIDGTKIFKDEPIKHFYIDKRGLMDLEQFYDIEYDVIRGYYYNEGFNNKINQLIKILFDLRAKYKKEKNPVQQTVKLLMNSIYGKSILKPIKTDTKIISPERLTHFVNLNYNFIKEIHEMNGKNAYAKLIKPIDKHFNVPQFGVSVLSWSKHIMNEVMCLADQKGLQVYYQDTDSLHIKEEDVPKLQTFFKETYGRELIGSNLCQFHCDFDEIEKGVPVHSNKLIALGKKCYVDLLEDEKGNTSYHIRMKGIPQEVIKREAEKRNITIEDLYMLMYKGEEITFNLLDGSNCFRKNDFYEMETPKAFARKIHFE